ncbi:SCO2521 family protein [Nocardia miyunensis]|uniref:SCO2521 family protein n=1 Tax=Nocardia miyunensis TaxID=282684 RepID=UPI00082C2420|nr:SCO2521 family protein [Nocardia miyunensis]
MTDANACADESILAVFGEIQTCLLPSRRVLDTPASVELLSAMKFGSTVTSRERPVPLVISPNRLEGVDCNLAQCRPARAGGKRVHVIGTVASRTVVIGGRVLQGSSQTTVVRAGGSDRQPWAHYLSRPGTVEAVSGSASSGSLVDGYLRPSAEDLLDLTSICGRMSNLTRVDPRLDQRIPFRRAGTTRLRWAVEVGEPTKHALPFSFRLDDDTVRSVRIVLPREHIADAQRFCEDLATHDWLLTAIGRVAGRFGVFETQPDAVLDELSPVLDELVPLWMPGAHASPQLRPIWEGLESDPGFTRQWTARVGQLRDRMTTTTLKVLQHSKTHNAGLGGL